MVGQAGKFVQYNFRGGVYDSNKNVKSAVVSIKSRDPIISIQESDRVRGRNTNVSNAGQPKENHKKITPIV